MKSAIPAVNVSQEFNCDVAGRLSNEKHLAVAGADRALSYEYWPEGALKRRQAPDGVWSGNYSYDLAGRLLSIDNAITTSAAQADLYISSISYNARGTTDFHAVKTRRDCICGGFAEVLDNAWEFIQFECTRLRDIDEAVVDKRLGFGRDRRGCNGCCTVLLQIDVRDSADMPELQENPPALGVHSGRNLTPTVDLGLRVDARRVLVTLPLL